VKDRTADTSLGLGAELLSLQFAVNHPYIGGVVKQHGHLSLSRVFQAGHYGQPTYTSNFFLTSY